MQRQCVEVPMKILARAVSFCVLMLAAGCGSDSKPKADGSPPVGQEAGTSGTCTSSSTPQASKGSCDQPQGLKQCWEDTGSMWSDQALAKSSCPGGTYSSTNRCPAATVGRCLRNCGRSGELVLFYSEGDAASLKDGCEAKGLGTWLGI
jgi:hypothetical protein